MYGIGISNSIIEMDVYILLCYYEYSGRHLACRSWCCLVNQIESKLKSTTFKMNK